MIHGIIMAHVVGADRYHGRDRPAPASPMFLGAMIMGPLTAG